MGRIWVQPRKKVYQLSLGTLMVLLTSQLQGSFEGRSCRFRGSLSQIALTQKNLDHHPIGLTSERDLQMFTCFSKVTGIKQCST